MPDGRLENTRKSYRCGRSFVIIPWPHCDCRGCNYARQVPRLIAEGWAAMKKNGAVIDWYKDQGHEVLQAERSVGIREVVGSSPTVPSTSSAGSQFP